MAYKACFRCELLFEVDEASADRDVACPQCGGPLDDYEPDEDDLAGDAQPSVEMPAQGDSGIVATRAFDGLAAAVREQLAARKARIDAVSDPVPEVPAPSVARAVPVAVPSVGDKGPGATKVLDAISGDMLAGLAPRAPAPMEPTSQLGGDLVAEVRAAPPAAEPGPARPRRRYGTSEDDRPRRTVVADVDELADEVGPPGDAGSFSRPSRPSGGGAGRVVLIVALLVVVGAGGGAAVWWFALRDTGAGTTVEAPVSEAAPPKWDARLAAALENGQAVLPVVATELALEEGPFVAGGPEALATSAGDVPGLPSVKINEPLVESDGGGEWVRTLKTALDPLASGGGARLALALDGSVQVKALGRMAYSGFKAGFRKFGLVVGRDGLPGQHGVLPFSLHLPDAKLPEAGAVVVRIGRLGLMVTVLGPDGAQISEQKATIPRRESDNGLDLKALGERLDALRVAHAEVKTAVIYPTDDLSLDQLAIVVSGVRTARDKVRFPEIALSTR